MPRECATRWTDAIMGASRSPWHLRSLTLLALASACAGEVTCTQLNSEAGAPLTGKYGVMNHQRVDWFVNMESGSGSCQNKCRRNVCTTTSAYAGHDVWFMSHIGGDGWCRCPTDNCYADEFMYTATPSGVSSVFYNFRCVDMPPAPPGTPPLPPPLPPATPPSPYRADAAAIAADPHVSFAGGGGADFRGSHRDYYAFLSSPGYQFAPYFQEVDFWHISSTGLKQLVHGTYLTRAAWRVRTSRGKELLVKADAMRRGELDVYVPSSPAHSPGFTQ